MIARDHIITGTASAVFLCSAVYTVAYNVDLGLISKACSAAISYLSEVSSLYKLCAVPLYIFGLILPDCDMRASVVGRFFHIPVKHRTWTHSVWFVLPWLVLSYWFPPLVALAFGICLHDWWDGLSNGGVCFFYPITKYRDMPNGAHYKPNHRGFYATGSGDETFLTVAASLFAVLAVAYAVLFHKIHLL